jgi:hypothetical protein
MTQMSQDRRRDPTCRRRAVSGVRPRRPAEAGNEGPDGRLDRLRTLKGRYDPSNLFRDNFNVVPSPLESLRA